MGFITIAKRCQILALIQLLWIITCAQSQNFQTNDHSSSQQISLELYGSGPFPWSEHIPEYHNQNLFHLQLNGLNLTSVLPGATSDSNVILKLRPQPLEHNKLKDQTNVLVITKNGSHYLQDNAESLFRGVVQLPFSAGNFSTATPHFHSEVLASGHINQAKRYIWLLAFIKLGDEYFYIRPYIGNSSSSSFSSSTSNVHLISRTSVQYFDLFKSQFRSSSRVKRSSIPKQPKRCPMEINVDYNLFERMERKQHKTIHFVQTVFSFANNIFLSTALSKSGHHSIEEEEVLEGYSNSLCRIKIYEERPEDNMSPLYNDRGYWDAESLLFNVLGRQPHLNNFCLSYLFTELRIIEAKNQDVNGYAVVDGLYSNDPKKPKVGAVSFHDCPDALDLHCMLTFAHELGHSWGAEHDPQSKECVPDEGGNYLMGTPSFFEKGPNNMIFSPCSVRFIYQTVTKISEGTFGSYCSLCGNGLIDPGEECDEGVDSEKHCCTEQCTLLENAQCSHFNHDCCTEHCKMADAGVVCRRTDKLFCRLEALCTGTYLTCPPAAKAPDGTICSEDGGGKCSKGYCTTSCPKDFVNCTCPGLPGTAEHMQNQCYMCCRHNSTGSKCQHTVPRPTGFFCYATLNQTALGACRAGYCEEIEMVPPPSEPDDDGETGKGVGFWFIIISFFTITAVVMVLVALYLFRKNYPKRMAKRVQLYRQQQKEQKEEEEKEEKEEEKDREKEDENEDDEEEEEEQKEDVQQKTLAYTSVHVHVEVQVEDGENDAKKKEHSKPTVYENGNGQLRRPS